MIGAGRFRICSDQCLNMRNHSVVVRRTGYALCISFLALSVRFLEGKHSKTTLLLWCSQNKIATSRDTKRQVDVRKKFRLNELVELDLNQFKNILFGDFQKKFSTTLA